MLKVVSDCACNHTIYLIVDVMYCVLLYVDVFLERVLLAKLHRIQKSYFIKVRVKEIF